MRIILTKNVRPEFRRLIKDFGSFVFLAQWLGCSQSNLAKMKERGYLSVKYAKIAHQKSAGNYDVVKLAKIGEISKQELKQWLSGLQSAE